MSFAAVRAFLLKAGNDQKIHGKPFLRFAKRTGKKLFTSSDFLRNCLRFLTARYPRVFIYHRFAPPGSRAPHKMPADVFRRHLELMADRYNVMTLADCAAYFNKKGTWPKKAAVITVDDGYRDFYQYAYPELRRLSLPASFYVTVNFVDKKKILWYDRLRYAIENTPEKSLQLEFGTNTEKIFPLNNPEEKFAAWKALSDFCIASRDHVKWEVIAAVESALGKPPPEVAPPEYEPVTWEELRLMSENGIEIGSHTLNHPILSKILRDQLEFEIVMSKQILEERLNRPVSTFSYPNGMPQDINKDVVDMVQGSGYIGATTCYGVIPRSPFKIPRMGAVQNMIDFAVKLDGTYHVSELLKTLYNPNLAGIKE